MKAVVTGADGFAGSHLVDFLLATGQDVTAIIRSTPTKNLPRNPKLSIVQADILDLKSLERAFAGHEQVYHLAAVSGVEETRRMPEQTWTTNTLGTLNTIQACRTVGVKKMLYASTCHVQGNDIYAASKRSAEDICSAFPDLPIVITRAYNHYGERQRPEWLIPKIILQALNRNEIHLGNPNPRRDFSYVFDIVRGYYLAMLKGKGTYELCSGVMRPVSQVVDTVVDLLDWKGKIFYEQEYFRTQDFTLHASTFERAYRDLNFYPTFDFRDGLRRTIEWYRGKTL